MPFTKFNNVDSFRLRERLPIAMGGPEIFHIKTKKIPALLIYLFKTRFELSICGLRLATECLPSSSAKRRQTPPPRWRAATRSAVSRSPNMTTMIELNSGCRIKNCSVRSTKRGPDKGHQPRLQARVVCINVTTRVITEQTIQICSNPYPQPLVQRS